MKKKVLKIAILAVVFAAVVGVGVTLAMRGTTQANEKEYVLPGRTIPDVTVSENLGSSVGLTGFTVPMAEEDVSDTIVPIGTDGVLLLSVSKPEDRKNVRISEISYSVRNIDTGELIELSPVREEFDGAADSFEVSLQLTNLLAQDTEYYLSVDLTTGEHDHIYYYTRVFKGGTGTLKEIVEFAETFSEATFDRTKAEELLPVYIRTDDSMANDDYGMINIHSSYRLMTWRNLKVTMLTPRRLTFYEAGPSQATLRISYSANIKDTDETATGANGSNATPAAKVNESDEVFLVTENYTVRKRNSRFYLLDYEREVEQIFDPKRDVEAGSVNIGITPEKTHMMLSSPNGNLTAFEEEGTLYLLNTSTGELTTLYEVCRADGRTDGDEYYVHPVRLTNEGELDFYVSGYMYCGNHEGQCGLSFFHYDLESGYAVEQFFAPSNLPGRLMESEVTIGAYITANDICYLTFGEKIYAIVLDGKDQYVVTDAFARGHSVLSEDNLYAAWECRDEDMIFGNSLAFMNLSSGRITEITLENALSAAGMSDGDDCFLKVLGFIDNDLLYGIGRYGDYEKKPGQAEVIRLCALNIMDCESLEVVGKYRKDKICVVDTENGDNRMILHRQRKDGGVWKDETDDILILNRAVSGVNDSYYGSDLKSYDSLNMLRRYRIGITAVTPVANGTAMTFHAVGTRENKKNPREVGGDELKLYRDYRVYARGRLLGIYDTMEEAVHEAGAVNGSVRRNRADDLPKQLLWGVNPKADNCALKLTEASLKELKEKGQALYVNGLSVQDMKYYLDAGMPVFVREESGQTVVLCGYKGEKEILMCPETGTDKTETVSLSRAEERFADCEAVVFLLANP